MKIPGRAVDLNDLLYVAWVVEYGGFSQAGRALGVPKSQLSRRIALLEERLGVRLIQRSTRCFSTTDTGQDYFRHCKAMLVEAATEEEAIDLTRSEPRGVVRVASPIALLHSSVGPMIADTLAKNPKVDIALDATNRRVDVVGEGIDLAIRVRLPPLEDSDLVVRVSKRTWCMAASPSLLERDGAPEVLADIARLPTADLTSRDHSHVWDLSGPGGAVASVHHTPRIVTDDMITLRAASLAGVGIDMLPMMMLADGLNREDHVPVLPDWTPRHGIIHAVFPSRRGLLPSARALIDHLSANFEAIKED